MSSRTIVAVLALALLGSPRAEAQDDAERGLRFGVAVGLVGQFPIGDDVGQDGAPDDEFGPALAIQLDFLTFDIGRCVQVVPFFRRSVVGGVNEDTYQTVFGEAAEVTDGYLTQVGIGGRWLPWPLQFGRTRPFISLYLSYVESRVTYEVDISDQLPPGTEDLFGTYTDVWRHSGMGLTLGAGFRWDFDVAFWGQEWLLPLVLEAQWTKNFWLNREGSTDLGFDESLLAPEGMHLDSLNVVLTVGLMY